MTKSKLSFMFFLPTKAATALLLILLSCLPAAAGVPDWIRSQAGQPLPKFANDTSAVILMEEQSTSVDHEGEIKTVYRRVYKILRPEGRRYAQVPVYFDQETRLTYLKGWCISAQGAEYEAKEKEALETSPFAEALYMDMRLKVLTIPAAEPGSVIGYEYEQRRRPFVMQDLWRFQGDLPVLHSRFFLKLPEHWEYHAHFLNHAEVEVQPAGDRQWKWELENITAIEEEPSMPALRGLAGQLAVSYFPTKAVARSSPLRSWQDVGAWYEHLASSSLETTPEITRKVAELTATKTTQLDKVRALAAFVQREVRYVAVEIGIGGYQPHPAASIFSNRYGDCKDKATLLSTMLRGIGVDSYYVLTHSERGVITPEFPSALNFNHVILAIQLPQETPGADFPVVWNHPRLGRLLLFDPTSEFTPLGSLPAQEQGNRGLLVTPEGGELIELPLLQASTNRLERSARLQLDPWGRLSGEVKEVRSGFPAAQYRVLLLRATPADREKIMQSFLGKFLNGAQVTHLTVENLDEIDKSLVVSYSFVAAQYGKNAGNLLLVRPRVVGEKAVDVPEPESRTEPFEFPALSMDTDEFELSLPPGYRLDSLPKPVHADFSFAEYQSAVELHDNALRYTRSYQVKGLTVSRDKLADLKSFLRQVAGEERNVVVLKRIQ